MEDFIEALYQNAFIITQLKEYSFLTNKGHLRDARSVYDSAMKQLEQLLSGIALTDAATACRLQETALKIRDSFDDLSLSTGLVNGELIPAMYDYIKSFTGIEVEANKYLIRSSKTGFLTLQDTETGQYLHETYDPMWQAYQIVQAEYSSQTDRFLVFGCGLGYIPYQIWHQSEGAVKIILFEEDETIIDFAEKYGVLSLIPADNLEIIHEDDKTLLADRFINMVDSLTAFDSLYFCTWKKPIYKNLLSDKLNRLIINHDLLSEMKERSAVNLWKNRKTKSISFDIISSKFEYDEWIVVSAGPSFDESISFLKDTGRGIIAVNTVLRRMCKENITPDIVVAADQYIQMEDHIKGLEAYTENVFLIADWLTNWKYIEKFRGNISFVKTNTNTLLSDYDSIKAPVWDVNGTVACLAIEAAVRLGASRIFLIGQDLAYPDGKRYANDMPHEVSSSTNYEMFVPSVDGKMVGTCEAFDWFRKAIEYQISKYPDIEFTNMSRHGAYIKGAKANTL